MDEKNNSFVLDDSGFCPDIIGAMKNKPFQPHTLQLKKPFGRRFLHVLLGLAALVLMIEVLSRLIILPRVPFAPSFGSTNPEFEAKIYSLDYLVRQNGSIDCILLGSSMTDNGIDPAGVEAAYYAQTGRKITCYNFGLVTLTGEAAGEVAEILVKRYHPQILIYGASPRDFDDRYGELTRPMLSTAWFRLQRGEFSFSGWLMDTARTLQWFQVANQILDDHERRVIHSYSVAMQTNGYIPSTARMDENFDPGDFILLSGYQINPPDWQGYEKLVALAATETHILINEMPVYPTFYPNYVEGGVAGYQALFLQPVQALAAVAGADFLESQSAIADQISFEGWADMRHFNAQGASVYAQWLGDQLAVRYPHLGTAGED